MQKKMKNETPEVTIIVKPTDISLEMTIHMGRHDKDALKTMASRERRETHEWLEDETMISLQFGAPQVVERETVRTSGQVSEWLRNGPLSTETAQRRKRPRTRSKKEECCGVGSCGGGDSKRGGGESVGK